MIKKLDAVGQIGRRVMARQMLNARLALLLLDNIFMGGHPVAILHGMVLDHDGAVIELVDGLSVFTPRDDLSAQDDILLTHSRCIHPDIKQMTENIFKMSTQLQKMLGQTIDARIGFIADYKPPVRIYHAQALTDIVDRCVETNILPLELNLALLRHLGVCHLVGDILMGYHPVQRFRIGMRVSIVRLPRITSRLFSCAPLRLAKSSVV
ncbi:MAG: hypothetical protein MO846_08125 [Candidatus Devosia symbiotica]|nr:hypothetical protein [Candidatus Devosia symbiotica]